MIMINRNITPYRYLIKSETKNPKVKIVGFRRGTVQEDIELYYRDLKIFSSKNRTPMLVTMTYRYRDGNEYSLDFFYLYNYKYRKYQHFYAGWFITENCRPTLKDLILKFLRFLKNTIKKVYKNVKSKLNILKDKITYYKNELIYFYYKNNLSKFLKLKNNKQYSQTKNRIN